MVQIFDPAPSQGQAGQLGQSLGGFLGNLVQGRQQQGQMQQQQQKQMQQQGILSKALAGLASSEELALLEPQAQLEVAKLGQQQQMQQNKPPPGGISGQSVPPEISQAIPRILNANPEATADELAVQFDEIGIPRAYSNSYIENRRRQDEQKSARADKRFESERSYQSQRSMPFLKKMDEERASLDDKDQALFLMRNAIEEGNLEFFGKDNFAKSLGRFGEGLRTAKGAQLINAQKEFLLGNIARAGTRPNQYIEQQISAMLPQIGRSDEANLGVVESFQASQDVARKKQEVATQLSDQYEKDLGYVPGNIASQVDEAVKPYAQEIQSRLAYNIRNIQENEMGEAKLKQNLNKKVSSGTPLTLQTAKLFFNETGSKDAALKKAKSLGYYIPSLEEYRKYKQ